MKFNTNNYRGFTFIELLVALTIFSIIATSVYYTLNGGIRVWLRGNELIKENQFMRVFFDEISKDFKNAVYYSGFEPEWLPDKVLFPCVIAVYSNGKISTELVKAVYYFDGEKKEFVKIAATFREGFNEEYADKKVMLDNVESVNFEYCYGLEEEGEIQWKDEWAVKEGEKISLPRGIKIKVILSNENLPPKTLEKTVFIPLGSLGKEE